MPRAELFTHTTIAKLAWPETPDGDYARRYLLPMLLNEPQRYIHNIHNTELMAVKVGETVLPISITDFHPENSYTCSPYSHYITYGGFEEVHRLKNPPAEALIKLLLRPIAWYFRHSNFDRVVHVNNWLLSTNLYPPLTADQINALADALAGWFPTRAIVFRSVDNFCNPLLYRTLQARGYEMVLSRQVWYQNPQMSLALKRLREDIRITSRNGHVVSDQLADEELPRAVELYKQLYLDKYSYFNPQFTEEFVRLARDKKLLHLRTLRREDQVNAVMGYFVRNGAMTAPLFGYDTHLPQTDGLYRMLSLLMLREGLNQGLTVHASAGVGKFKKLRGGKATIEYNAVFTRHLPSHRHGPWTIVKAISKLAIPIMQKNDL